jgi:bla regulator protein blaR1
MIATVLSIVRAAVPPIANHLWQSTAFVLAVSLLTLLFGRNRARVRFFLWLAASAKFLVPFSAFMALGSLVPLPHPPSPAAKSSLIFPTYIVNQRFSAGAVTRGLSAQNLAPHFGAWIPAGLAVIWAFGFASVLLTWCMRWKYVSRMLRRSIRADESREADILRRIENDAKARTRTRFLVSGELMEPGVCGIFRPVMLWPAKLSSRLEDAHIEAILAHEVAHVQHRDNLTASIHMIVEAIFWFHPFVWWIERKMIEERERACDEVVIQSANRAEIYAESLLKVSRFCAEFPLSCVSGITGADLRRRIESIMAPRFTDLGIRKRLLLWTLAASVIAGPVACGFMRKAPSPRPAQISGVPPLPSFEVASVKPNHSGSHFSITSIGVLNGSLGPAVPKDRFVATNTTIKMLICWAWAGDSLSWSDDRVSGGPGWINSDRYDINGKLEDSQVAALEELAPQDRVPQIKLMVQSLLKDRFGLVVRNTMLTVPVFALVAARGGPKLQETVAGSSSAIEIDGHPARVLKRVGEIKGHAIPVSTLAQWMSQDELGRPVVDRTGLTGKYDVDLKWTPDLNGSMAPGSPLTGATPPDASGPSIFTAVQEQLGLKLEPSTGPEDALRIVHIEKPTAN